jgi:hypothetical protein
MLAAPLDGLLIDVDAMKFRIWIIAKKPAQGSSAPATEIQHPTGLRQVHTHQSQMLFDQSRASFANAQEFFAGNQFTHAESEHCRRQGNPVFSVRS